MLLQVYNVLSIYKKKLKGNSLTYIACGVRRNVVSAAFRAGNHGDGGGGGDGLHKGCLI